MILDAFDEYKQDVDIYSIGGGFDPLTGQTSASDTLIGTYEAIFYRLSSSAVLNYERLGSTVGAKMIIDPAVAPTLTDKMYIIVDSIKWYFSPPNNIMDIDESIEVDLLREPLP